MKVTIRIGLLKESEKNNIDFPNAQIILEKEEGFVPRKGDDICLNEICDINENSLASKVTYIGITYRDGNEYVSVAGETVIVTEKELKEFKNTSNLGMWEYSELS